MIKINDVEFSEETIKAALIKAGHTFDKPKPKFEPIDFGGFTISVDFASSYSCPVIIKKERYSVTVFSTTEVVRIIIALQSAIDFVEANK